MLLFFKAHVKGYTKKDGTVVAPHEDRRANISGPDWVKPCWLVAIKNTLGLPESKIKALATKNGWDGVSEGAKVDQVIMMVWDVIGKMPDLSLTRAASTFTPKNLSGSALVDGKTGLVFTRTHVMPMVNGRLSNFNGHGEERVIAVATYDKRSE